MHSKRLTNAGSKAISLHKERNETSHVFEIGAVREIPKRLLSGDTGPQFQRQKV
jgi:hypothetical protein